MKKSSYMTRAMQARDPRFARVLSRLGYERTDMVVTEPAEKKPATSTNTPAPKGKVAEGRDLTALRKQYQEVIGKKPFAGWDAETLQAKIAAAKG